MSKEFGKQSVLNLCKIALGSKTFVINSKNTSNLDEVGWNSKLFTDVGKTEQPSLFSRYLFVFGDGDGDGRMGKFKNIGP